MRRHKLDILCLQETWKSDAQYYCTDDQFLVILSGAVATGVPTRCSGVGFIISPTARGLLRGFLQFSDRLAYIKLFNGTGVTGIFSAYAPHNLRPLPERAQFYSDLGTLYDKCSVDGPKVIFGDYNARLGQCKPGEEGTIGPFGFGAEARHSVDMPNRDLLLEFCFGFDLTIANTFSDTTDDKKVTFREAGFQPLAEVCSRGFALLDLLLVERHLLHCVKDLRSWRTEALPSNHFLISCVLDTFLVKRMKSCRQSSICPGRLSEPGVRQEFVNAFMNHMESQEQTQGTSVVWKHCCDAFSLAVQAIPAGELPPKKPWISRPTLVLIEQRFRARASGNPAEEK